MIRNGIFVAAAALVALVPASASADEGVAPQYVQCVDQKAPDNFGQMAVESYIAYSADDMESQQKFWDVFDQIWADCASQSWSFSQNDGARRFTAVTISARGSYAALKELGLSDIFLEEMVEIERRRVKGLQIEGEMAEAFVRELDRTDIPEGQDMLIAQLTAMYIQSVVELEQGPPAL